MVGRGTDWRPAAPPASQVSWSQNDGDNRYDNLFIIAHYLQVPRHLQLHAAMPATFPHCCVRLLGGIA